MTDFDNLQQVMQHKHAQHVSLKIDHLVSLGGFQIQISRQVCLETYKVKFPPVSTFFKNTFSFPGNFC